MQEKNLLPEVAVNYLRREAERIMGGKISFLWSPCTVFSELHAEVHVQFSLLVNVLHHPENGCVKK